MKIEALLTPQSTIAELRSSDKPRLLQDLAAKPVDIVFLLLTPAAEKGDHLNALAAVARKLREPERLQEIRLAETDAALYLAMTRVS
jgi:PTS system nitrogen regulatory IIA component